MASFRKFLIREFLLLVFFLTQATAGWSKCPMCRLALQEGGTRLVEGFYLSIILLVGLPLLIFLAMWLAYRHFKEKSDAASLK